MLNRLMTLAIGLAVVYLILTQAVPYLRDQFGSQPVSLGSDADSTDSQCVGRAQQANDQLISMARSYGQPPVDVEGWSNSLWEIESELQTARSVCNCSSEACEAASRALDEMSSLLSNLDGLVRGDSPGFANPGHQQEQILQYLEQARSAVGF
jgi:hypothetical protein